MNRKKNLFRGKRVDNSEWVFGSLLSFDDGGTAILPSKAKVFFQQGTTTICCNECHKVDPYTVGQYTGLADKNGVKIFEGDICRNSRTGKVVSVQWDGTMAGYVWSKRKKESYLYEWGELFRAYDKYEVIGNIHDNPEMMEGGGEA